MLCFVWNIVYVCTVDTQSEVFDFSVNIIIWFNVVNQIDTLTALVIFFGVFI